MAEVPEQIAKRFAELQNKDLIWHRWNVFFGIGSILASGFGSAFNFMEESNHILWSSVTLIGTACAGIATFLYPRTRQERYEKATQHLRIPIIQYEEDRIDVDQLIKALNEAEVIVGGGSPGPSEVQVAQVSTES